MVNKGYIKSSHQQAFLQGITGCTENVEVPQEVIQDAKARKMSVHISELDLSDAFGSISHALIKFCLEKLNLPGKERNYIHYFYSRLRGEISINNWVSEDFKFLRGIFQCDPYCPNIFLLVFQPLLTSSSGTRRLMATSCLEASRVHGPHLQALQVDCTFFL